MNRPRIKDYEDHQEYLISLNQYANDLEDLLKEKKIDINNLYFKGEIVSCPDNNDSWPDNDREINTVDVKKSVSIPLTVVALVLFVCLVLAAIIAGTWKI